MSGAGVVAVCLSDSGGVPKHPQPSIMIGHHGVEGDYHAGPTRTNSNGQQVPNQRQVSIVALEAIEAVSEALSIEIPHGGLGENILVSGLGDLGDLQPGARLIFGSGVELEVVEQNDPCVNLSVYHPQAVKQLYGRRGVLAVVVNPGALSPGDSVSVT